MLRIWSLCRQTGFESASLPDGGSVMEQSAIMMDAFAIMNSAAAQYKKKA